MRNMKKLLSAVTALSLVTVTGISTVACGPNEVAPSKMNAQVLRDLGLYKANNSDIELSIKDANWEIAKLNGITANSLLDQEGKALSQASKDFLMATLGLMPTEDGIFDQTEGIKITLSLVEGSVKAELEKISGDFRLKSGTFLGQWKNQYKNLGPQYLLELKNSETTSGIVAAALPSVEELTLANFDSTKAPLSKFTVGGNKEDIQFPEITSLLDTTQGAGKKLLDLAQFIDQGELVATVVGDTVEEGRDIFEIGDSLIVKINFRETKTDTVQFPTEYKLTLTEED